MNGSTPTAVDAADRRRAGERETRNVGAAGGRRTGSAELRARAMHSSPTAFSVWTAAASAIAPRTFGLPASSRSGRSAHATESS